MTAAVVIVIAVLLIAVAGLIVRQRLEQESQDRQQNEVDHDVLEPQLDDLDPAGSHDDAPRRFILQPPNAQLAALEAEVVAARESLLFGDDNVGTSGTPKAWNGVAQMVPTIAGALQKGEVVRILGPQALIDGLRTHALSPTMTSTGAIGVVKGPNGQFVGHLRFGSAEQAAVPATVAGPLLLFQAASVVTMQYYLHQITSRLMDLQAGIDELKVALSAQTAGQIRSAASMVLDLENFAAAGVPFSADDRNKLQHAESQVREAHETLKDKLSQFERDVFTVIDETGLVRDKVKADQVKVLLTTRAADAAKDALLAVEATAVRVRISRLRAFAEMDADPARFEVARGNVERELEQLGTDYGRLRSSFDRLNLRRSQVEERWVFSDVDSELESYREKTKGLRALIRTPERRLLPPSPPEQAWIVELRQGDRGVESRYALLEEATTTTADFN